MKASVALALWLIALPALAAEEIHAFHSDIDVRADGSMLVVETIRVQIENKKIKRGIYRDFPTLYKTDGGSRVRVDFRVVSIERDGKREAYHTRRLSNGIRVYMGRKAVILKPGIYTYRITYMTDRQLGFFEGHDELYWNVTGHGWGFPIRRAGAQVRLPGGVPSGAISAEAYTGKHGTRGADYRAEIQDHGANFTMTRALAPGEGLTIVVQWPKGFVFEPDWRDRLQYRWRDDPAVFVVWIGSGVLFLYYLFAWFVVGRDPKAGVVMPEYEPPEGYPPAALRMVRRMGWDDKALSSALVGLAVKGALKISEDDDVYTVSPTGKRPESLSPGEDAVLRNVGAVSMVFKSGNHERVKALRDAHREELENAYEKKYFYSNKGWLLVGWMITIGVVGYAAIGFFNSWGAQSVPVLFIGCFFIAFLVPLAKSLWVLREKHARVKANWLRAVVSAASFVMLASTFGVGMVKEFGMLLSLPLVCGVLAIAAVNVVFNELVKAPTLRGRKLLDRIDGFRDYLSIAESDELRFKYSKEVTPERFEQYLPYAIALDVETEWAERFAAALRAKGLEPSGYHATWYDGHSFTGVRGLSSSVGSAMASTVSSSSRAPGSSSGGGGGGFSGGGGGGGGGGGW